MNTTARTRQCVGAFLQVETRFGLFVSCTRVMFHLSPKSELGITCAQEQQVEKKQGTIQ